MNSNFELFLVAMWTNYIRLLLLCVDLQSPKLSVAAIPSSNALMIINVTNLSVSGSIEADGHNVVSAELGDIEIIDTREKSSDKLYVLKTIVLFAVLWWSYRTTKLLQSFKADPTKQSSTETSGPLVKVKLNSSAKSCEDYGMT